MTPTKPKQEKVEMPEFGKDPIKDFVIRAYYSGEGRDSYLPHELVQDLRLMFHSAVEEAREETIRNAVNVWDTAIFYSQLGEGKLNEKIMENHFREFVEHYGSAERAGKND